MDEKIYFQIRVETDPFFMENGKFTIFLSTCPDKLDPVECNDDIEEILGCELMEGIWVIDSIGECDTEDSIRKTLLSYGFIESSKLN